LDLKILLALSVLADSIVAHTTMISGATSKVHPFVRVLTTHGETILIVNIVGLPCVPVFVRPGVSV